MPTNPYRLILFAVGAVGALIVAPRLLPVLVAVVFTILFAIAFDAPVAALERVGLNRALGTSIVVIALGVVVVGVGLLVVPTVVGQLGNLSDQHGDLRLAVIEEANKVLANNAFPGGPIPSDAGEDLAADLVEMQMVRDTGALIGLAGLSLFAAMWAVANPVPLQRRILSFVKPEHRPQVRSVAAAIAGRLRRWVIGQSILNIAVGISTYALLRTLGVPFAAVFAFAAAVFESVPTIGIIVAATGPVVLLLLDDPGRVVWLLIGIAVIQQLEDRILIPTVMRHAVDIPQTILILVLLAFALLIGPAGVVVAVPVTAAAVTIHDELRRHHLIGDSDDPDWPDPDTHPDAAGPGVTPLTT